MMGVESNGQEMKENRLTRMDQHRSQITGGCEGDEEVREVWIRRGYHRIQIREGGWLR